MAYRRVCDCDPPATAGDCPTCGGRAANPRRRSRATSPAAGAPAPEPEQKRGARGWLHLPGRFRTIVSRELGRIDRASRTAPLDEEQLGRLAALATVCARLNTVRLANDKLADDPGGPSIGGLTDAQLREAAGN